VAYPSHIARAALRAALRSSTGDVVGVLHGRLVNSLTIAELNAALIALGHDPDVIARAAVRSHSVTPAPDTLDTLDETSDEPQAIEAPAIEDEPTPDEDPHGDAAAIEAEMQSIRGLIATGGFSAFDDRLRALVIEARKPAVEIRVEVPTDGGSTAITHASKPTGKHATWRALFGIQGPLGKRETALWDGMHPHTPAIDDRYVWPACTAAILTQIARGKNIMLFGPAGTGKTQFMAQLAAKTGRPYALISCDNGTEAAALKGMTVPDASGGVTWQDGQLTRAIKTPGCIICLDEPSVARAGALFVLQNVLEDRKLFLDETGERVTVAPSVIFSATDNTNGTGGGSRKGYTDTNRLNHAFLDRLSVRVKFDYMSPDSEARVIVAKTGCTSELARLLVSAATVTRAAANDATLSHGIGLRRLFAWAELLTDGIGAADAFEMAILNCAAEQDVEALREQCLLAYDDSNVKRALEAVAQGGN
jgi:MoxR-like ATPase